MNFNLFATDKVFWDLPGGTLFSKYNYDYLQMQ